MEELDGDEEARQDGGAGGGVGDVGAGVRWLSRGCRSQHPAVEA
jgi:hypothetical protein